MKASSSVKPFLFHPRAPLLTPPLSGSTIVGFVAALNRWLRHCWDLWDEPVLHQNTTHPFTVYLQPPVLCLGDESNLVS